MDKSNLNTAGRSERQTWVIDALEDGIGRLEAPDGRTFHVPQVWLPLRINEGDHLRITQTSAGDGTVLELTIRVDPEAAVEQRLRMDEQVARLRARDPGGDISL